MNRSEQLIVLSKNIVAIAIESSEGETPKHASFVQLPTGTAMTIVGVGFSSSTVKVRCNDHSYFVFLRDIEEPDTSYYLP